MLLRERVALARKPQRLGIEAFLNGIDLLVDRVWVTPREDDNPNDAIVVNRPSKTATEWIARRGSWSEKTVAADNPEYPADAPVIVVVFADALQAAFPDWASGIAPVDTPVSAKRVVETGSPTLKREPSGER